MVAALYQAYTVTLQRTNGRSSHRARKDQRRPNEKPPQLANRLRALRLSDRSDENASKCYRMYCTKGTFGIILGRSRSNTFPSFVLLQVPLRPSSLVMLPKRVKSHFSDHDSYCTWNLDLLHARRPHAYIYYINRFYVVYL